MVAVERNVDVALERHVDSAGRLTPAVHRGSNQGSTFSGRGEWGAHALSCAKKLGDGRGESSRVLLRRVLRRTLA